jgi:hypothetical protein
MSKDNNPDLTGEIEEVFERLGINPHIDWKNRINVSDVLYILDHWPFLQMVDGGTSPLSTEQLQLLTAKSGWKIHSYRDALSSSPGEFLFGGAGEEGGEGGEGGAKPGKGTIVNQAVMTAFEMVELARQYGWEKIKLVDGHPLMLWAAWMQAEDLNIEIVGYQPSEHDFARRRRIKRSRSAEETLLYRPPMP